MSRVTIGVKRSGSNIPTEDITMSALRHDFSALCSSSRTPAYVNAPPPYHVSFGYLFLKARWMKKVNAHLLSVTGD
jgi:hypothetical protein